MAPSGRRRAPGLTIYLWSERGYLPSSTSSAFPSWTAVEIHAALNEDRELGGSISDSTAAVLRRVGRLMRADTGTGADDDPFLREERAESRAEAIAEGRAQSLVEGMAEGRKQGLLEGLAEGRAEGRARGLADGQARGQIEALLGIFSLRGLYVTGTFPAAGRGRCPSRSTRCSAPPTNVRTKRTSSFASMPPIGTDQTPIERGDVFHDTCLHCKQARTSLRPDTVMKTRSRWRASRSGISTTT